MGSICSSCDLLIEQISALLARMHTDIFKKLLTHVNCHVSEVVCGSFLVFVFVLFF